MKPIFFKLLFIPLLINFGLADFKAYHNEPCSTGIIHRVIDTGPDGRTIVKTTIVIDASTTREEIISGCQQLQLEGVSLTFDKLTIKKALFGIMGKPRISYAKGLIRVPGGKSEEFEVGGNLNFKFLKIYYSQVGNSGNISLDMVEIID